VDTVEKVGTEPNETFRRPLEFGAELSERLTSDEKSPRPVTRGQLEQPEYHDALTAPVAEPLLLSETRLPVDETDTIAGHVVHKMETVAEPEVAKPYAMPVKLVPKTPRDVSRSQLVHATESVTAELGVTMLTAAACSAVNVPTEVMLGHVMHWMEREAELPARLTAWSAESKPTDCMGPLHVVHETYKDDGDDGPTETALSKGVSASP